MTVGFLCSFFALLMFYENLKTIGFVSTQDFNDSRFCSFERVQ